MINIQLNHIKSLSKLEEHKKDENSIVNKLFNIDVNEYFDSDFISPNGNTIHDFERMIKRLGSCNTSMVYDYAEHANAENGDVKSRYKLVETNACNNYTLCNSCAKARSQKLYSNLMPYVKTLKKMPVNFYMVTLTIKNNPVAKSGEAYQLLRDSWTSFVKMGQNRKDGRRSRGEASKIIGYSMAIEASADSVRMGYAHIHAHILVVTTRDNPINFVVYDQEKIKPLNKKYGKKRIPQAELDEIVLQHLKNVDGTIVTNGEKPIPASKISQEWYAATGNTAMNIDVKLIKDGPVWSKKRKRMEYRDLESQIQETVKYPVKTWEFGEVDDLLYLWDSIQGKKRLTRGGVFSKRNLKEWVQHLERHKLTNYFKEFYIESDSNIFDEIEGHEFLDRSYIPVVWNERKFKFCSPDDSSLFGEDYEFNFDLGALKKLRSLRSKALNVYRKHISVLKLKIGTVKNVDWIIEKESLVKEYKYTVRKIHSLVTFATSFVKFAKSLPPPPPRQLNVFDEFNKNLDSNMVPV